MAIHPLIRDSRDNDPALPWHNLPACFVPSASAVMAALATLRHHSIIPGQDGNDCKIWLDPASAELAAALQRTVPDGVPVLRGLLSETGLFVWQGACLRHAAFERATGMDGIRLQLGYGSILVHEDVLTLAGLPWASDEGFDLDVEERRAAVAGYLATHARVVAIYPSGSTLGWYS